MFQVRIRHDGYVYRIDEVVHRDGFYITWPDAYASEASARAYLEKLGYRNVSVAEPETLTG